MTAGDRQGRDHPGATAREPAGNARAWRRRARGTGRGAGPSPVRRAAEPGAGGEARGGARGGRDRGRGGPARAPGGATRRDPPGLRERLAGLPGQPPADAPLVCLDTETTGLATAAGTLAFLVGLARWDGPMSPADAAPAPRPRRRAGAPGGDRPVGHARRMAGVLQRPRVRLAPDRGPGPARRGWPAPAHAGHLDLLPFVRRVFRDPAWRTPACAPWRRSSWASRASATWKAGRSRRRPRGAAGRSHRGVGGCRDPQREGRALAGASSWPMSSTATRTAQPATRRPAATWPALPAPMHGTAATTRRSSAWTTLSRPRRRCGIRSGRTPVAPTAVREASHGERDEWWSPRVRPNFGGRAPGSGWRGDLANGRGGPLGAVAVGGGLGHPLGPLDGRAPCRRAGTNASAARSLGRGSRGMAGGRGGRRGLGAIAGIEVAKLREHRLDDPGGALAATRAAWRLLERLRATGRAHPRLEADLQRRGARLAARIRRRSASQATAVPQSGLSPPCMRLTASARYGTPKTPGPSRISGRTPPRGAGPGPGRPIRT